MSTGDTEKSRPGLTGPLLCPGGENGFGPLGGVRVGTLTLTRGPCPLCLGREQHVGGGVVRGVLSASSTRGGFHTIELLHSLNSGCSSSRYPSSSNYRSIWHSFHFFNYKRLQRVDEPTLQNPL